jgi:hypothetical protein
MFTKILLFESHARAAPLPRHAAARTKERFDQVRQTTCDIHKQAARRTEVEGGIFKNLFKLMMR